MCARGHPGWLRRPQRTGGSNAAAAAGAGGGRNLAGARKLQAERGDRRRPAGGRHDRNRIRCPWLAWQSSYAHTSDTSQILPRSWGLAVRELLLAARPKFTGIYVGNGLRFAEIRLSRLKKHTHTHTSDTHARLPTSESGCGQPVEPGPRRGAWWLVPAAASSQPSRLGPPGRGRDGDHS
eukprot:COSAG01_NODE_2597_length_7400_cov_37.453363_4_plen_180_part_00